MSSCPGRVVISRSAYETIQSGLKCASNQREIGGVLIGTQTQTGVHVTAVTLDAGNPSSTMTRFVLDGALHTRLAQEIIDAADVPQYVLGVWHSHICDGAVFSAQDRLANRQLAATLNGALSLLALWENDSPHLHGYYITPDNRTIQQTIEIN